MTGPSHRAILRVEKVSASEEKIVRRFATTVFLPSTNKVDIVCAAVFADPKRSTRSGKSGSFSADGGVEGKVCVCDTYGSLDVERALSYAKKEGALALIATEEPKQKVDVPTILISRNQLRSIKDELQGAFVSISYISGSYETHSVTLIIQRFSADESTFEWEGKMRVPANTTDHLDLKLEFVSEALSFRNQQGDIVEFVNKAEMAGRVCLVGDCTSDRYFTDIVHLAAQYGATALFTTYEKPPFRDIPLPVVVVGRKFFDELKKPDVIVSFKYKSDAQTTMVSEPESKAKPTAPKSYASALTESASKSPARPQAKPAKKNYWDILGDTLGSVGRSVGLMKYNPQSMKRFKAIVANGTSWSKDVHLYHEAMELLAWVDRVENPQDRQTELESLNEAIGGMINDHSGVGDVMIVAFCAKLHNLLSHEASLQLRENAVKLIKNIKIDESDSISANVDTADLNKYIIDLVNHVSFLPVNKGNMTGFVLNALWIRVHHCQSLENGRWDRLQEISTRTLFKDEQETLLSFMPSSQFNTLAVCAATSFRDVCALFSGEDKVSVLRGALPRLQRLYQSDKTDRVDWQGEFGSIREVTAITLLDRFEVETGDHEMLKAKIPFINCIVQRIERNSIRAFSDFGCVYDCLGVDSVLSDFVTELMMKSICSSLEDLRDVLSPTSVSELIQMDIGRHLLSDRKGFIALKSYIERGIFKRYRGQDKEKLVLLGRISSSFINSESCTDEEAATLILDAILTCVNTSRNCYELCLTAIDVSQNVQDIFYDGYNSNLPSSIGEIFIRETGICSTIRSSPSMLRHVASRFQSRQDGHLSYFLHQALVRGLEDECKNIVNAISFYESFSEGDSDHSIESRNIVYDIVIKSFGNWNPSSIIDLLKLDAPLLKTIHHVLVTISAEECAEEIRQKKSRDCLGILHAVADKWREKFEKDKWSMTELQMARSVLTDAKQEVLTNIVGTQFPSPSDIDEKIAEMNNLVETIRSSLTFSVAKDDDTFTLSISDLATHYRIKIEPPLSHLISKYLSGVDPDVELCSIRRDSKHIIDFVSANEKQLQAASHFRFFRSALFQNENGVWAEIHFDEFFAKVSASLRQLEFLLSPAASFSSVSVAASVLDRDNIGFDGEMTAIITFLHLDDDERTRVELKDVMTLSKLAKQLSNFVECCKTFKFAFAESDDCFSELETICNQMNSNEGGDWDVDQCLQAGKRIVEILLPPSIAADLSKRLEYYLPLIEFFDALRHCSSILDLAREKSWFGTKGLSNFYKEYENVTNSFNQKQSFEMAVLDRLEPTIQCISAVGGNLQCDRVATLLQILDSKKSDFSHQSITAMRQVQENICKIQDWLSEGMDDMVAITGKLVLIQSSGRIVISSEDSMDEATPPMREMLLHFSRADGSNVTMNESEVRELVQYLGFTTHESDESRMNAERFVRVYEQCGKVMAYQQEMADVGFGGSDATKRFELILGDKSEELALEWLSEADKKIDECKGWLGQVRSSNRYSLLFWIEELRFIFQCMCGLRSGGGDEGAIEWQLLVNILSQMPLNPNFSNLIEQFAAEDLSGRSWLERVSIFVSECGNQGHPAPSHGSKNVTIHKVDCLDNTIFAAQLQLMHHIYKNRCPASIEYLDASCIKSSHHVAMFLERVRAFPEHRFVIAHVERLAASEQDLVATFIAKHAKSADTIHLHCIQAKDTVLYASPGVSISAWNDSSLNEYYPSQWLQDCVASKGHINDITIVFSDTPCSGKTRFIRSELERSKATGAQIASIYIHEDFTLTKAVEQLRDKFGEGGSDKSVHFGFSWSCDSKPSDEFLMSVNHLFNSFLLFGNLYDPTSGNSFYGASYKWTVFVEMNACAEDEDAAQVWLRDHVPILSYCSLHVLQPPSDFLIDNKARRVATYLRAYDDGSIDRKFNSTPSNKSILFVLDKSGSMTSLIDGRTRFQVASESMLSVFNSHIRIMDSVGLVLFDHNVDEVVPFQRIENDQDLISVRREITNLTIGPDGGTNMYTALRRTLESVSNSTRGQDEDVWVICLTDGESADRPDLIREQLRHSPDNLHVILIGVGLRDCYHQAMRDLCNKYQVVNQPNNKGIFLPTALDINDIQATFNEVASRIPVSQTFELDGAMSDEQCRDWLDRYRPHFISPANKLVYSFWVSFIYRRVSVFDASEDFNYNETYDSLGSSLMKVMLDESEQMLMRDQTDRSWSLSKHTQLIYDFSRPESPKFRLICTSPDDLDPAQKEKLEQLNLPGFAIPNTMELRRRETLDRYLSQALSIPLTEDENGNQFLQCVNDHKFVLTLDFTLKLLNIHEHVACGAPCVMEGETGVSKTALTKMYSILVNSQQMTIASASTTETLELILQELWTAFPDIALDDEDCVLERILTFLELSSQHTATDVGRAVTIISGNISLASSRRSPLFLDMPSCVMSNDGDSDDELARTKEMLTWFSESHLEQLFFDINIHASLTADNIKEKISEAKRVASKVAGLDMKVVVFLDEINTASILGLIKEIIVDRSLNGDPLEESIVIVAACNPVRKSSLSQATANRVIDLGREWVSGHYQVRQLPPSLSIICWDFGALKREQEKEFIQQRILMMDGSMSNSLTSRMTEILSSSHEFIRELARDHIVKSYSLANMHESEAVLRARSVVSLRDIQRVFHLTSFFLNQFKLEESTKRTHRFRRAMLVSVAIVYYLRLDAAARNVFVQKLNNLPTERDEECSLLDALGSAMDTVIKATEIPEGISLTSGLKENIFVTLVCTLSRVPLMIIGPPGCSKTLAVSIVNDNANGEESPSQYYRDLARIQPFHYQCSKSSTSTEVASVFSRAEQRQMNVDRARQQCLVFMDEAGLPEEERESLKVLHYLLEGHMSSSPNVAFVCITNHILDAAKSNRCACLLRPEPDMEELSCISKGVLGQKLQEDRNGVELVCFREQVVEMKEFSERMCSCYMDLMKNTDCFNFFVDFFGLRDFIHFLKFLRRSAPPVTDSILHITEQVFLNALERNFNGIDKEKFANMCAFFLAKSLSSCDQIKPTLETYLRDPMEVIHNALSEEHAKNISRYNLPRYKMIIDHTNDDSVTRLLQIAGVLNSSHAFYKLSGIDEGAEIEKLNLVSRVKFAAQYGEKTVVLSQVESISECFYDLFNQHFKEFRKEDGDVSYFANIAIGGVSRPCLISPSFQCIVHVQGKQIAEIPAPFLNRFEKFQLSIDDILRWKLKQLTPGLRDILGQSLQRSQEFISSIGASSVWSPSPEDTLKSIYISLIRNEACSKNDLQKRECGESIALDVLEFILNNFDVDTTVEDIQSCIDSARVEYRNSKDGVELERVIDCVSRGKIALPFDDVLNDCLRTPISRALKQIILSSITRCAVIRLLQLVRPDALYLRRHAIPGDVLQIYFGDQEHFSLKRLIGKLCESHSTTNQFHIIYARSDSCAHSLPSWSNIDGVDPSTLHRVRSLVHDNPSAVEIRHLDLLKSESEIRTAFDNWASKSLVNIFILVVDMKLQSTNIVNFIRSYVEQATLPTGKQFLLLLHFPLSCDNSIYPALFLGKWRCTFIDGIGDADGNNVDFNNVLQSACSLTGQKLNADSLLRALKPKALQYVASQVPFYSCSKKPHSINQAMTLTERMDRMEEILASNVEQATLEKILCSKFVVMWTNDRIREVVYSSAYGLASGKSRLSFSSALTSTLQSSFNKFLAKSVLEINLWANLDVVLDRSSVDAETDRVFSLVLNSLPLPGVPLQELLLIRDLSHPLQPLPMEVKSREAIVVFPFYYQISSLIEMAIDQSNFDFLDQTSLDQNDDFGFLERVDAALGEMADSMDPMAGVVRDIVTYVAESECLFGRYLQHTLEWTYGCKNSAAVEKWITLKMGVASTLDASLHYNILYLHIICRKNVGGILRLDSWDSEDIAKELLRNEVQCEGISFVSTIVSHFLRLVGENFEANEWSNSFSVFLQSIPALMEGDEIKDEDLLINLRLLILLNVLISVDVEERAVLRIVQLITENTPSKEIATLSGCLDLVKEAMGETLDRAKDAHEQLLRIFFSPWWLNIISNKVYHGDAVFLMSAIKEQRDYIKEQMAVVHLRNVLTSRRGNANASQSTLPTSSFLPSIVVLLSCELTATHVERFSEESGDRVGMPHFVPHWLYTEGINTPPLADCPIDEVEWYLRNYQNSFDDCPLAKVIFDIIFRELLEKARGINSNELLIMFQTSIEEQKEVSQATIARLMRRPGQASLEGPVSIKGCYVRALETDALLLTFVCKVAEDLATTSRSFALEGVNALCAIRILNGVMPLFRWPDLFFKVIMRLNGSGHLANLLSESGPLHNFEWCQQWMQGLSSHKRDVEIRLSRAETALREAEIDEDNKVRQFRRCPHCNELFGVDQMNCGMFNCGRDAHGANGGPAIGGTAVQGGYGCGRPFRVEESTPYARDETLLEPLREELRASRILFEAANQGAELWARAERLDIPPMSFHLLNEEGTSMSKIFNIALVDQLRQTTERENICRLAAILDKLPRLEHVSCLPDMIEFYMFIHKTFRHVVTRDESFNMKLRDIMDERLLRARFGVVHASHLHSLWLRVVEKVNSFLSANDSSVMFDCEDVAVSFSDLRDVPLVQVLSEAEHPSHGHDTLFLVISDLLMRYNNFIISVSTFKNTRSVEKPEEIHPRSLVRGSKNSIAVKVLSEEVASGLGSLIESYWEERSFALDGLLGAIQREFDIIGSLQTVMAPLSFLRERFVFRDCYVGTNNILDESDQCFFSPIKQFYFAQREDWMLYEDVRDKALRKCIIGGKDGTCSIRHKMIVTFQSLGHGEWSSLLEGMRNTLDGLDFSSAQEFGEAIKLLGIDSLQAIGFPAMDGAGAVLVHTLSEGDIIEFIDVCGEQLSSEAYQFNRLPSRLSEPMVADVRESLETNIQLLLQTKSSKHVHDEIQAFCEDILSFYEPHIVTVSELSNEPLGSYLRRNNAWDNADSICAALPSKLGIRNYVDIRKVFHQLKLRLRQTEHGEIKLDSEVLPDLETPDSNAWKWVARPSHNRGAEENAQGSVFDRLWFEEAIRPRDADTPTTTTMEEEADQTASADSEDAATLDEGSVEDVNEEVPDDLEEVANEVAYDVDEVTDNIEEDDTAATAALSAHHSTPENQVGSTFVQAAGKVPVEVNKKQWQMPAMVATAFVIIFTALVYCWGWSALSIDDEAGVESNEIEKCKDDIMAALAAESNE